MISSASDLSLEFGNKAKGKPASVDMGATKWKAPHGTYVKVNLNVLFMADSHTAGMVFMARNSEGFVLASRGKCIKDVCDVEIVEAMAFLFGISVAWECGFTEVEVESDAISVIQLLHSLSTKSSPLYLIIEDILLKSKCYRCISFSYINCSCNKVAHVIASWALSIAEDQILIEKVPQNISPLVLFDAGFAF